MMCQKNCASTVHRAIISVKGVEHAVVTFATSDALVWIHREDEEGGVVDPSLSIQQGIISEVEDVGYDIELLSSSIESKLYQSSEPDFILEINTITSSSSSSSNNNNNNNNIATVNKSVSSSLSSSSSSSSFSLISSIILAVDGVYDVKVDNDKRFSIWGIADSNSVISSLLLRGGFHASIYDPNNSNSNSCNGDNGSDGFTSPETVSPTTLSSRSINTTITEYLFDITGRYSKNRALCFLYW